MRPNKPAMRLAVAIHKQLVCRDSTNAVCELPEASWQQCQVLSRRVQRAQQRGWRLAARRCERDFRAVIDRLHGDLAVIAQRLDSSDRTRDRLGRRRRSVSTWHQVCVTKVDIRCARTRVMCRILLGDRVLLETPNHSKQTCTSRRAVLAKSKIRDFATGG
jgi:hypothetical protein